MRPPRVIPDEDLRAGKAPPELDGLAGFGDTFQARIPADLIAKHPPSPGAVLPYGISFVHFAACGGELRRAPEGEAFPLRCVDPTSGVALGAAQRQARIDAEAGAVDLGAGDLR